MKKRIFSILAVLTVLVSTIMCVPFFAQAGATDEDDVLIVRDFDGITSLDPNEWFIDRGAVGSVETAAENVYGGTGKSLKVEYTFGGEFNPRILNLYSFADATGYDGLSLWAKSSQEITVQVVWALTNSYDAYAVGQFTIPAGEGIVKVPFSAIDTKGLTVNSLRQPAFEILSGAATSGTLYIDALGYYKEPKVEHVAHPEDVKVVKDFDGLTAIDPNEWLIDRGATGALETNKDLVHGGTGTSLKVTYAKDGETLPRILNWYEFADATGYDGFTFWANSSQEIQIQIAFALTAGYDAYAVGKFTVPAGESLVKVPFSALTTNGVAVNKLRQPGLDIIPGESASGTLYIDAFGYYKEPKVEHVAHPEDVKVVKDFNGLTAIDPNEWLIDRGATGALENDAEFVHGGEGTSLKVTYAYDGVNYPRVLNLYSFSDATGYDGLTFWANSSQEIEVQIAFALTAGYDAYAVGKVTVPAGESLVKIPFSSLNTGGLKVNSLRQPGFDIIPGDSASGTLYIDAFGYYKDAVKHAVHEKDVKVVKDFDGLTAIDTNEWLIDRGATGALENDANLVHGGEGTSLKVTYTKDGETLPRILNLYTLADATGFEGLAFWANSSQEIQIQIAFALTDGYDAYAVGKVTVPAGESIVKIPFDSLNTNGLKVNKLRQPGFDIIPGESASGTLYIDAIGYYGVVYESDEEMDPTQRTHDENTLIWYDMETYDEYSEMAEAWKSWFANVETGEGAVGELETDPSNAYGGVGQSFHLKYDRTKAQWNKPAIIHSGTINRYGDGITFWIKSDHNVTISFDGLDSKSNLFYMEKELVAGENIVTFKWEDFKPHTPGVELDLKWIYQFVIAPTGSDTNLKGNFWLDAFG